MNYLTTFLDWLLNRNPYYSGLNDDPRFDSEKQLDFAHEERLATLPANPFTNPQITESPYPYENQRSTSSCVPHSVGLALAIERKNDLGDYVRIAPMFPYRLRSNYPSEGCYLQEIFDLYRKNGAPLYDTMPTPITEAQANNLWIPLSAYDEAAIFKGLEYWTLKSMYNDIGTLAGIAQQGHGVSILIYATYPEWAQEYPQIIVPGLRKGGATVVHCVTILPNSGFVKDGKKFVVIQDSALFGGFRLRYVSEDFIRARVYAAGYWLRVVALSTGPVPKYVFNNDLKYGATGPDVAALQQLLISQGLLPVGMMSGLFLGRTLAGVKAFQNRFASDILIPNGLTTPTGIFGPASRKKANELCK